MFSKLAIFFYVLFIALLFAKDRKLRPMASWALWIPFLWIVIIGSRPVSAWFGGGLRPESPQDYLKGSPVDASVYLLLIIVGLSVLVRRRISWGRLFASNRWFFAFFFYCLLSIMWSDYPVVAFKRWFKDFGNIVMVMIILSEKNHVQAMKAIFLRYSYLTVTLSVLFIKYLPEFGRTYNPWTWQVMDVGVTEDKNTLGSLALITGLFLIWDLIEMQTKQHRESSRTHESLLVRKGQRRDKVCLAGTGGHSRTKLATIIVGNKSMDRFDLLNRVLLLLMVVYLIDKADSSTSLLCLIIGICIIFLIRSSLAKRQVLIRNLGTYCLILILLLLFLYSFPDILRPLFELLGEDMTLTGRTDLWADLLQSPINPFLGRGYQSFWLGSEATNLWEKYYFHPNQAHNGYLETYLNGGLIGVCLLIAVIVSTGSKLKKEMLLGSNFGILCFSFLVILVFSNWTEASFNKLCLQWIILIASALNYSLSNMSIPRNLAQSRSSDIVGTKFNYKSKVPAKYKANVQFKMKYKNEGK